MDRFSGPGFSQGSMGIENDLDKIDLDEGHDVLGLNTTCCKNCMERGFCLVAAVRGQLVDGSGFGRGAETVQAYYLVAPVLFG